MAGLLVFIPRCRQVVRAVLLNAITGICPSLCCEHFATDHVIKLELASIEIGQERCVVGWNTPAHIQTRTCVNRDRPGTLCCWLEYSCIECVLG